MAHSTPAAADEGTGGFVSQPVIGEMNGAILQFAFDQDITSKTMIVADGVSYFQGKDYTIEDKTITFKNAPKAKNATLICLG